MTEVERIRKLRADGDEAFAAEAKSYVAKIRKAAEDNPEAVGAQIEAAYGCDSLGTEEDAIGFYDAAWRLGVPAELRKKFIVGYGSTLRNVGRSNESIELLESAIAEHPDYPAYRAFLGLALHELGRSDEGLSRMIEALVSADTGALEGYERALTYYASVLSGDRKAE